jgi:hypothetical protein
MGMRITITTDNKIIIQVYTPKQSEGARKKYTKLRENFIPIPQAITVPFFLLLLYS